MGDCAHSIAAIIYNWTSQSTQGRTDVNDSYSTVLAQFAVTCWYSHSTSPLKTFIQNPLDFRFYQIVLAQFQIFFSSILFRNLQLLFLKNEQIQAKVLKMLKYLCYSHMVFGMHITWLVAHLELKIWLIGYALGKNGLYQASPGFTGASREFIELHRA